MNVLLLAAGAGLCAGLVAGFLIGAYMVLRDHADLIDDGQAFRALVADMTSRPTSAGRTAVGDVRGEAHVTHLRVVGGGAA